MTQMSDKLSKAEIAGLVNVNAGAVVHHFHEHGNVYHGPRGLGARSYFRLAKLHLIEDVPGAARGSRNFRQQLTRAGREALDKAKRS